MKKKIWKKNFQKKFSIFFEKKIAKKKFPLKNNFFGLKLEHHKGTKVAESFLKKSLGVRNSKKQFGWHFWKFSTIFLDADIKIFWIFIFYLSFEISNTLGELLVCKKCFWHFTSGKNPFWDFVFGHFLYSYTLWHWWWSSLKNLEFGQSVMHTGIVIWRCKMITPNIFINKD